jgi:hypothetical protein
MILIFLNYLPSLLVLLRDFLGVLIIEAMSFVSEPNANRHAQPVLMRIIEHFGKIIRAPGADGIAAKFAEQFLRPIAASPFDEIGLAVAE